MRYPAWFFVIASALGIGYVAGGRINDADKCRCRVQFFADYSTKVDDLDRREKQLRAFVVGRAVPQRMPGHVEDPRMLGEWQLDPESLEWFRPHFGVDRSRLKPSGAAGDAPP